MSRRKLFVSVSNEMTKKHRLFTLEGSRLCAWEVKG